MVVCCTPVIYIARYQSSSCSSLLSHRVLPTAAATIVKAEDIEGRIWAMKRIQSDSQSIREAERLVKLRSHPLVVPLQGIFMDSGVTFLQMPFYTNGDLRRWVEQIKVH